MSNNKVLYVITRAPYSNASGQEAIDAILIGASFDLDISVLFIHDGVFQIKSEQNTKRQKLKQFTKAYKAFDDFGIEKIYTHDLSIAARGLDESELICSTICLNSDGVRDLIACQHRVFTF